MNAVASANRLHSSLIRIHGEGFEVWEEIGQEKDEKQPSYLGLLGRLKSHITDREGLADFSSDEEARWVEDEEVEEGKVFYREGQPWKCEVE
jgi:hypothetical protein